MYVIDIQVVKKRAYSPTDRIVCGNSDYKVHFHFDEEWAEHDLKTARFVWNGQYVDVVFTGDVCDVPVISNAKMCAVGVFAGDLRTTTPAMIPCSKSILCGSESPAEPSEDVYAQLMQIFNEASDSAIVSAQAAAKSAAAAANAEAGAKQVEASVAADKDAAAEQARLAAASAQAAAQSAANVKEVENSVAEVLEISEQAKVMLDDAAGLVAEINATAQEVRNEANDAENHSKNAQQYAQNSYNYMEIANKYAVETGTNVAKAANSAAEASTHAANAKSEREAAEVAANYAFERADAAYQSKIEAKQYRDEAMQAAGGGIKTVNGQKPDENGNVEVVAGAQSDWNQNDPAANDYVKGRTHYEDRRMLIPPLTATAYTHDTLGAMWVVEDVKLPLTVGEMYTVIYNGATFTCECKPAPAGLSSDPNAVAMGNFAAVGGEDTGEPFGMLISVRYYRIDIIDLSGAESVKIQVNRAKTQKLPAKYLPDGVPYLNGIVDVLPECHPAYDEIDQCFVLVDRVPLEAGEIYTVNWNGVGYSCAAHEITDGGYTFGVLGDFDGANGGESTGEPFLMVTFPPELIAMVAGFGTQIVALDGSTELTISIQKESEGRKLPVELLPDGLTVGGLTADQISALDGMFKIIAYTEDASAAYTAFKVAFGIEDSGGEVEPDVPDEPDVHTHSYTSAVTTVATCTTTGVRTYTCSCGHSYTEAIPATGHNYVDGACTKCGATDPNYDAGGDEPETTDPVYQLAEATTFNADKVIDTGYKLLDKEKSWSVCIDCTDSSKGGTVWDASPAPVQGLTLSDRSGAVRTLVVAGSLYKTIADALGDYKIIVTHTKNTDLIEYYYVLPGSSQLVSGEITYTKYLTDSNIINSNPKTLKLGGNSNGEPSYRGIVHRFEIYERVLGEDEIYEFTNAEVQGEIVYIVPPCVIPSDNIVAGYVGNNGVLTALADNYTAKTFIKVNSGSSYTVDATELFNISALNKTFRYAWYDNAGVFVSRSSKNFSTTNKVVTITPPATAEYMVVGLGYSGLTEENVAEMFAKVTISEVTA